MKIKKTKSLLTKRTIPRLPANLSKYTNRKKIKIKSGVRRPGKTQTAKIVLNQKQHKHIYNTNKTTTKNQCMMRSSDSIRPGTLSILSTISMPDLFYCSLNN